MSGACRSTGTNSSALPPPSPVLKIPASANRLPRKSSGFHCPGPPANRTPVSVMTGTIAESACLRVTDICPGSMIAFCRTQPAPSRGSESRLMSREASETESESPATPFTTNGVPLNFAASSRKRLCCSPVSWRGDCNLMNASLSSAASFSALAVRDRRLRISICRSRFFRFSSAASFSFLNARSTASPAATWDKATNWLFLSRNSVSTVRELTFIPNSPATPMATNPAPNISKTNIRILGLSGVLITARRNSESSWRYAVITTASSSTTPITTGIIQNNSHFSSASERLSSDLAALSRASDALLRAEASMDHLRQTRITGLLVTLIGLGAVIGAKIVVFWWRR